VYKKLFLPAGDSDFVRMTAVNVTLVLVIAGLTRNLCKQMTFLDISG
jgi:hypothetical protein